jgi:hypothetical protein
MPSAGHTAVLGPPPSGNALARPAASIETARHRPVTAAADVAPMRVLYCSDTYPPQINGVSVVTALSAAGLARRGWDCGVIAPSYPASIENDWRPGAGDIPPTASLPRRELP